MLGSFARDHIAGLDERVGARAARAHVLVAQAPEDIYIELVVREDHKVLEVLRIGASVMEKPVQGIVDARSTEQRKRRGCAGTPLYRAVGDRVVHGGKIRGVEQVAHRSLDA